MKQGLQIGFVVAALGFAGYVISTQGGKKVSARQGSGPAEVKVVAAPAVLEDYIANATATGVGLKGLWFVVHGTVKDVTEETVVLDTGGQYDIECVLTDKADAKKVKKGDTAGFAGKGAEGAMANVPVTSAWYLDSGEWQGKEMTTINIP